METYRVPQRKIPVRVALADGASLDGALFAPAAGPDGAPGRLIDRLNEEEEHFLALAGPDESFLLSKSALVAVHLGPEDGQLEVHDGEQSNVVEVRIVLESGVELEGRVAYTMPPEKRRILDYFNATQGFVALARVDGMTLFNRDRVVRILDIRPE
jgi:hypothetical protein